jgi:hypothetical protein
VADADLTFSAGGDQGIAALSDGTHAYGVAWPSPLPPPTLDGPAATYANVAGEVDLEVRALTSGFQMSFLVPEPPTSPLTFDLPLALEGLTAAVDEQEQLLLTDAQGTVVARADPAQMSGTTMSETNDEPVVVAPVDVSIVQGPQGPVLHVAPDMAFFTRPDVTYPVRVDPSPSFTVDVDTFVKSNAATSSFSTASQLKVGLGDDTGVARSLLSFAGVADALSGTEIYAATLRLHQIDAYSCTPSEVGVYGLTGSVASSTTWNTQPSIGSLYASASEAHGISGCSAAWIELSGGGTSGLTLVDLLQSWANGGTAYGVEVRAGDEASANGWKKFDSANAGSNVPTLEVTYGDYGDTSDNEDGSSWWDTTDDDGMWGEDTISFDPYGLRRATFQPVASFEYKSIDAGGEEPLVLNAYEWDPPSTGSVTHYPVIVLVHGGAGAWAPRPTSRASPRSCPPAPRPTATTWARARTST